MSTKFLFKWRVKTSSDSDMQKLSGFHSNYTVSHSTEYRRICSMSWKTRRELFWLLGLVWVGHGWRRQRTTHEYCWSLNFNDDDSTCAKQEQENVCCCSLCGKTDSWTRRESVRRRHFHDEYFASKRARKKSMSGLMFRETLTRNCVHDFPH